MTIFRRYYLREFFKFFAITLLCFTAISIVAEFFDKATEFYREQPPVILIIEYLLLQAPRVVLYALPFASLFSILMTIGMAEKWREITVIRASGNSVKKVFSSFLVLGVIISLTALILGESLVPEATRKASYIRKVEILKQSPRIVNRREALWMRGTDGSLVRVSGFVEDENRVLKTSIFMFDSAFAMIRRIEAGSAEWMRDHWELKDVTVFNLDTGTREEFSSYSTISLEEPRIFREEIKKPKEMNFMELYKYYARLEKAGFKNLKYTVRLYEKLAYPTINFVMVLFGLALALNTEWGGGIRSAGLGVIISLLYWLLYSLSISLGNTGIIRPWLAPWISPVVFAAIGTALYLKIRE